MPQLQQQTGQQPVGNEKSGRHQPAAAFAADNGGKQPLQRPPQSESEHLKQGNYGNKNTNIHKITLSKTAKNSFSDGLSLLKKTETGRLKPFIRFF